KDAVPINQNSRRFAIFFSAIQSKSDLERLGMDDSYFSRFYDWLGIDSAGNVSHAKGLASIAGWLMRREISKGGIAMRAPKTTSEAEAIGLGRGPISQVLVEVIEANDIPGLKDGWVHTAAAAQVLNEYGIKQPAPKTLATILDQLGYHKIRKDQRRWGNVAGGRRGTLWHKNPNADPETFQGDQSNGGGGDVVTLPMPGRMPAR
ncbi:MAG: hypothetical protein DI498_11430, partial [Paracoccus denitrificans]